jgi:hypothetical protein
MNSPLILALVGMAGIIITALFTFAAARRKGGGTIKTSEAADLWGQTQVLLAQYAEQSKMAMAESAASRAESAALRKELEEVRQELRTVRDALRRLQDSGALS